jgi:ribonuclease HIII
MTCYTRALSDAEAKLLEAQLRARGYRFDPVPHARFGASRDDVKVVLYQSGKLVVQGKGTAGFVEFVLEPEILTRVELGYEALLHPELLEPRLGVDESGKGDLFGPLCIAGVYVNENVLGRWKDAGIRDSKAIGSDRTIAALARLIRATPGCVTTVVPIGNAAYNRLHSKLGSVNAILAWGHARVIENLVGQQHRMDPPPVRAVVDQFAASKLTVARALMSGGRQIELVQRHKAESDAAVAAASIMARNEFVSRLAALGLEMGMNLPKGAGAEANAALLEFVARHGSEALPGIAKMHFRNLLQIKGSVGKTG